MSVTMAQFQEALDQALKQEYLRGYERGKQIGFRLGYHDALGEAAEALYDPSDGPVVMGCQFNDNEEAAQWLRNRIPAAWAADISRGAQETITDKKDWKVDTDGPGGDQ